MKALTLTQPWATLVAIGAKAIETRVWSTRYRGLIAIHAAKGFPADARAWSAVEPFRSALGPEILHTGKIIAVAELTNCYRFDEGTEDAVRRGSRREIWPPHEAAFGDFSAGRFGFALGAVRRLAEPVEARGMLSLWELPADVAREVQMQLTVDLAGV